MSRHHQITVKLIIKPEGLYDKFESYLLASICL